MIDAAVARRLLSLLSIAFRSGSRDVFVAVRGVMLDGDNLTLMFGNRCRMLWLVCISDIVQELLEGWKGAVAILQMDKMVKVALPEDLESME